MPEVNSTVSQLEIKIDGSPINTEYMNYLLEAVVDQSTNLPHMFMLRFRDHQQKMLDDTIFSPAKTVEISAKDEADTRTVIFKGEITAVEPEFREGMLLDMVIRGYDKSHRMYREVKSRSFLNKKDSDMASQIAGEHDARAAGRSPGITFTTVKMLMLDAIRMVDFDVEADTAQPGTLIYGK